MLFDTPPRLVARVCVDSPLPHLDRLFDYLVPDELRDKASAGCRVKIRFAGRLLLGFIVELASDTGFDGKLRPIDKLVSAEPVLSEDVAQLARAVADRYAGNLSDVLRLAIPPRQARVENETSHTPDQQVAAPAMAGWERYELGGSFMEALRKLRAPRIVWQAVAGEKWAVRFAEAAAVMATVNKGTLLVVPDQRDLDQLDAALIDVLGPDQHVTLSASAGPAKRYRAFLAARRGAVQVVAGTRAAMLAPVQQLGLVMIWDDGDDSHAEPRAPYPHAREVLLTRAERNGAAAIVGGYVCTTQAQLLVETSWARSVRADRQTLRAATPRVVPVGDDADLAADPDSGSARLPTAAWRAARKALEADAPVLVQTPRRGYIPAVSCQRCRARAKCSQCHGPLSLPSAKATPVCRWCARPATDYACEECGSRHLRSTVIGAGRTAEELGRAFPGVVVHTYDAIKTGTSIEDGPAIVVATPGSEPAAPDGYGAVLLLDTWALLSRADLRAEEETLRRWAAAAALARPAAAGGTVVVVADGGLPTVQALVRWDPTWFASRELSTRAQLRFPPAVRMASLTAASHDIAELVERAELPETVEVLGPVPLDDRTERLLLRVPRRDGPKLASGLHAAAAVRSVAKNTEPVRIHIDPRELL